MYTDDTSYTNDKCENIGKVVDDIVRLPNILFTSNDL